MKILVTGSSGFIGYHLSAKLLSLGYEVVGIDNHNDYYSPEFKEHRQNLLMQNNFKFYNQDINSINIKEKDFDIGINLAAQAGVRLPPTRQGLYQHSNINGYRKFCEFCLENRIKKIIYASSSSVYSDNGEGNFTENVTALKPKSEYGRSKLSNEGLSEELANTTDTEFIGLRFFSVYGPYGRPDMAYFLFTKAIKQQKIITLNNNGEMARDMTYIDDIIAGIVGSLELIDSGLKDKKHEIINLGNDSPITTLELLQALEVKLKKSTKIIHEITSNESAYTHADIAKAKKLLNYKPQIDFQEGIDRFLKWHKNNENF